MIRSIYKHMCWAACAVAGVFLVVHDADAQSLRRGFGVGVPSMGTDMWTQAMGGLRLFTPHRDNCDSTEVFIEVYTDGNSVQFGFCFDKDEHSAGALEFEDARQTCLDEGKRLPEPVEFKFVCQAAPTGVNNLTDDREWASNFAEAEPANTTTNVGVVVPAASTSCVASAHYSVTRSDSFSHTAAFRCVR